MALPAPVSASVDTVRRTYWWLISLLLLCTLASVVVTTLFLANDVLAWLTSKHGLVRDGTAVGYLVCCLILIVTSTPSRFRDNLLLSMPPLLLGLSELDVPVRFTTMGVFKTKFYSSSEVPLFEKGIVIVIMALLIWAGVVFISRFAAPFVRAHRVRHPGAAAVTIAVVLLVIAKAVEGADTKAIALGLTVTPQAIVVLHAIEEILECNAPLFLVLAVSTRRFYFKPPLQSRTERVASEIHQGRGVFVKRYNVVDNNRWRSAHQLISMLTWPRFVRGSPLTSPAGMVRRELRKLESFRKAGLLVPDVVAADLTSIVLSNVGRTAESLLKYYRKTDDPQAHDHLLIRMARALGEVHRAGLCHGRPHPRDMSPAVNGIYFFDFEEEPERSMPLVDAQARDLWLLFFQLRKLSIHPDTPSAALSAYAAAAPEAPYRRIFDMVYSIRWTIAVGRFAGKVHFGGDLENFLAATSFFLDEAVALRNARREQTETAV